MVSNISAAGLDKNTAFSGKKKNAQLSPAEKFIRDLNKVVKTQEEGNFAAKYMWSPTASIALYIPVVGYLLHEIPTIRKIKKTGDKAAKQAYKNKLIKKGSLFLAAGFAIFAGLEYLFSRNADKKYEKFKQDFFDINTDTYAKLRNQPLRSTVIGAMCCNVSEEVIFNRNMTLDPLQKRKLKKLIKHELVHAKQYETVVRSEDGIKKLNFACLKSCANMMNTSKTRKELEDIYNEINNDRTGKYDNVTLHLLGADVDFKNYINGIHTVLNDKNAGYNDVPMVIDAAHYQKVRNEKGSLTREETEKADKYYEALLNYPPLTFWNMTNPFSPYYNNLLEKEAYKESPNIITFIRHLFVKD